MIHLAVPNLNGNEKKYLDDCIDTTFVSSVGEYVNKFEGMVAEATGSEMAVACSAGTTGLHAALTAVGVKHNDLVILPTFTFIASANAIRHCGADPWLMDISEEDWCLDPGIVRALIEEECEKRPDGLFHKATNRRIAALMPVYTLGNIPDMKNFGEIADEYQIPLVVDAACAIGAKYKGESFGQLADLSVLSFNGNKTITCGGGGAVIGRDKKLLELVRHLTTTARVWPDYDFDMVGFNYRMTNVQAAIGCAQMERLDEFVARKRDVRAFYDKGLSVISDTCRFPTVDGSSCWFSGLVLCESNRDDIKRICVELGKNNIEARSFWKPIHLQSPYENCLKSKTVITDKIWDKIITLPSSTGITKEELKRVVDVIIGLL